MKNVVSKTYSSTDYITVAELKSHLRIVGNSDDTYLVSLLDGCFSHVSNLIGYSVIKSSVDYFFKSSEPLHIPARILELTSVKYRDSNGDLQTLAATNYDEVLTISANYGYDVTLINSAPSLYDYGWQYKVTVVEGFEKQSATTDDSKKLPADIRNAIYLLAEHYYTQRGTVVVGTIVQPLDFGHETLLSHYKIMQFV